jgi:hypothetical protein
VGTTDLWDLWAAPYNALFYGAISENSRRRFVSLAIDCHDANPEATLDHRGPPAAKVPTRTVYNQNI